MGLYQDALDYIFNYVNYERQSRYRYDAETFDLSRMVDLLDKLGRPQDQFQSVHIAGTKGKGSASAMVESVLRAAGYRTALYTSPHLHTFRERIRVNGRLIGKRELVDVLRASAPGHRIHARHHRVRDHDGAGVRLFRAHGSGLGRARGRAWAAGWMRPTSCARRSAASPR